ncbi:MAG: sodium-dependent transporter, partial [Rhodothermales bacterium]|nr:sodium-dependent transporter [Rhodothermales bacterium]
MAHEKADPAAQSRGAWKSKLGFILAASGSAIGLGNIVFFASNAYQYGGGAFYLPYFIALFVIGMPVMVLEFSLGTLTGRSFPVALGRTVGPKGEFVGWWSLSSALFITMYYMTILGWALCMMVGALNGLFEAGTTAPFAPFAEPSAEPSAIAYFFNVIATTWPLLAVLTIWLLNVFILWKGTATIEKAVRVFVPLMWLFMIGLIVRGLTLPGGFDGVLYLFTPNLDGIGDVSVWQGAFAQMFFSLSLGLGTMTAYASYLPKDADQVNNAMQVTFLNCGFEYIAGVAIFALLFVFALNPAGSTLSLSFFVIPQGIANFPIGVQAFGFAFFFLLVIAGLTSSVSLVEGMASALIDKLQIPRARALAMVVVPGAVGSLLCALPFVVDPELAGNGTVGLNLLDILDHWAFRYSLLTVGLMECVLVGWVFGADRLREAANRHSKFRLGSWFDVLIKFVVPALLLFVIAWNLVEDLTGGLYGGAYPLGPV